MTIQDHLAWDQIDDETLSFVKAIGVDCISVHPFPPEVKDGRDRADYWKEVRKRVESHGLKVNSAGAKTWDEITVGTPDRDEKIEALCTLIRNLGEAGIPTMSYNFKPIGNFRTASLPPGRGGSIYSTFDYDELMADPPHDPDKQIFEAQLLENMQVFLERVMPVAEEAGVRLALHPDDPPIPEPLGGCARIVSSLAHYRRVFDTVESASSGMLFCQGCVAEMGEDVCRAIQEFGGRKKIVYVHFRNIRGTPRKFQEVFLDEGDGDMYETMRAYKEVGFEGPFMMDHTPKFPNPDVTFWAGRAFAVGYMRALIQAVYR